MNDRFFSYLRKYGILTVKYLFFMFNLVLLTGLGVKTVSLWIKDPFVFSDTLAAFPEEPEFISPLAARNGFWIAVSLETLLFIIGGFLCYELLIKKKTFRRSILAPVIIAFLWTAGESIPLFLPATDKVRQINACRAMDISWDSGHHKCRFMDLEIRRFEQLKISKNNRKRAAVFLNAAKTNPDAGSVSSPVLKPSPDKKKSFPETAAK